MSDKANTYRDLLERWAAWWNGPGREHFSFPVIPPVSATFKALRCILCAGADSMDTAGERCAGCYRELKSH